MRGGDGLALGLERLLDSERGRLAGCDFGLLSNQASVDVRFRAAHHLLADAYPRRLRCLFFPQHGRFGEEQDNMIESPHSRDLDLDVPVYSLYGDERKPSPSMLADIDTLVIDLQDVGTRVYTFAWTICHCLEACRDAGVRVLVLDRPNPLGGLRVEGPLLDASCTSFVGLAPIPMAHGLTIGELTQWLNSWSGRSVGGGAELEVIELRGWSRTTRQPQTGRAWVPPSPNLPRFEGVDVYPGSVLLEGTNLSEGRGTTTPFEVLGAPFVDARRLLGELAACDLPGCVLREHRFRPTFQKWAGEICSGVWLHVVDEQVFDAYRTVARILYTIRQLWPLDFAWRPPPYEYESELLPIDILSGSSLLREAIDAGDGERLEDAARVDAEAWRSSCALHFLYET